ncbi:MAG: toll/interleukin-1 receptor domain-containing protein [Bacteroidaceae bacterium]|nr:toll/interleukin-1 receptor domain-containing protein [Bacteroidaceae bacterium]
MNNTETKKYYAFISYSSQDEKWAKWLHTSLEHYNLPTALCKQNPAIPKCVRPVFWYKHDLSGTTLSESLVRELNNSLYLIVICSPSSARSPWVNDEVKAFIAQGKSDKIIPFIVDGEPHSPNAENECFPPALLSLPREKEIRGINVREQGKSHALVDVIATMFGISFDTLWQRHRRRRIRLYSYAAFAILAAIILGIFYWDYNRATYEYYADYVDCNGVPRGVVPLKEDEVARRNKLYKFEKRRIPFGEPGMWGWRLSRVLYVNSAGTPQEHTNTEYKDRFSIQDIEYSKESGTVIRVNYCDTKGKVLLRHDLSERGRTVAGFADFKASAEEKGAGFAKANITSIFDADNTIQNKSNIVRYAYYRDEQGYITRQTFHSNNDYDLSRSITADGDGISGFQFTLDSLGRRVKVEFIDIEGKLCCNKKGVAGKEYEYDRYGNIAVARYFGLDGSLVLNELLWAECIDVADDNGNIIEATLYDDSHAPCLHKDGYHKVKAVYDSRGNVEERAFYGVDGSPCLHKDGIHKWVSVYDSRGNEEERAFYGVDGSPCLHKDGYHKVKAVYDSRGNMEEQSFYGVDGSPYLYKEGFHRICYEYSALGNYVSILFYDDKGKLLHENVPVVMMYPADNCKIAGLPSESVVLKWCVWEFGDGIDCFMEILERYRFSRKEVVYMTSSGEIKSFVSDETMLGVRLVDSIMSREQFKSIKKQYQEWKEANSKK